jgi:hypothetical protein
MGLIENELSELRALIKDFREGKVELETYKATLAGYREPTRPHLPATEKHTTEYQF